MSAVPVANGTRKVKNIKTGGTSTRPPVNINHSRSSNSMETQGAIEMFLGSVDKTGLRYTTFFGDGDSNCYASVCEALKNAPTCFIYEVKKEKCVGHIQKRIGTALREYKRKMKGIRLADGKSVSGKGRLTDVMINKFKIILVSVSETIRVTCRECKMIFGQYLST